MPLYGYTPPFGAKKKWKKRKLAKDSKQFQLKKNFKKDPRALKDSVKLPPGAEVHEWYAKCAQGPWHCKLLMNITELYNTMNVVYSIVSEFCTEETCPSMTAGPKVTYYWADQKAKIKPVSLPAPKYIETVALWMSAQFDDNSIYPPSDTANPVWSKDFLPTTQKIMSRIFRIYAHIYHHHWEKVRSLGAEPHVNTCFKEFDLVPIRDLSPMWSLIEKLDPEWAAARKIFLPVSSSGTGEAPPHSQHEAHEHELEQDDE